MTDAADIKFYHDNGYVLVKKLFGQDKITKGLIAIDEILLRNDADKNSEKEPKDSTVVRRIWSPTQKHETFVELAEDKQLLDVVQSLIGENILFHYSKLNMKGPRVGSIVEWHQDFSYYPHTNTDLLTVLIFLDDANKENGCLRVIPGSHRKGLLSHDIDGFFRGKLSDIDEDDAVYIEAEAGDVLFLHCLCMHASAVNSSPVPRRTFLPAYRSADAFPIYFGPHAAHNEAGIKLLRGQVSRQARVDSGIHYLPIAKSDFGSIYEVQEGSHESKSVDAMKKSGYAV